MLGDNCATVGWPACGAIDIMENIGVESPELDRSVLTGRTLHQIARGA